MRLSISQETVTSLSLLAHDIEDGVDEFRTLGVMSLGPVVTGPRLTEDEIVLTDK